MTDVASVALPPAREVRSSRMYLPELDTLRFTAFLAVFVFHGLPNDPGAFAGLGLPGPLAELAGLVVRAGSFGVDLFFCLSAFLITRLLIGEHATRGRIDIRAFYVRRTLRIWPLYLFAAFLYQAVLPLLGQGAFDPGALLAYLLFVANWFVAFGNDPGHASHLWSISFEEQYYLLWPPIIALFGVSRIGRVAIGMLVVAGASRALAIHLDASPEMRWMNSLLRLDPLAVGVLLAVLLPPGLALPGPVRILLCTAGAAIPLACLGMFGLNTPWDMLTYPLVATSCGMILTGALQGGRSGVLTNPVTVHLGKISYGLYVYHPLSLWIAGGVLERGGFVAAFLLTVVLAHLSYGLLEVPFLRLKERFEILRSRPV